MEQSSVDRISYELLFKECFYLTIGTIRFKMTIIKSLVETYHFIIKMFSIPFVMKLLIEKNRTIFVIKIILSIEVIAKL